MKKILIIRFSSIGDIVLTSPVIRCLRKRLPDAELHFCTKPIYKELIKSNPYIDKIHVLGGSVTKLAKDLRTEQYDFIVDLHGSLRSRLLRLLLLRPSATFNKLNIRKWLLVNLKINLLPQAHIVFRYLRTVYKLGVTNDGEGLDFFVPGSACYDPTWLPATHRGGYIAFVIGGKHGTKQFPAEKVIEVCRYLAYPVVLLGDRNDRMRGQQVCDALGKNVFNACGLMDLIQSALLVREAFLVITNDTGLMHIAAAFHKKIISLWGNTVPEFGMYPYLPESLCGQSVLFEEKGLGCRPCSKIGFEHCPKKHFNCMHRLSSAQIASAAKKLLAEAPTFRHE